MSSYLTPSPSLLIMFLLCPMHTHVRVCAFVCLHGCGVRGIQYYDCIVLIFEVSMHLILLIM